MAIEVSEGPEEVNEGNVVYWSRHARELHGTIKSKALKFLKYNCIHYIGPDSTFDSKYTFICLPLNTEETFEYKGTTFKKKAFERDYNISEYLMYKRESDKRWICNCQGWGAAERDKEKKREDGIQCSHLLGLIFAFKVKRFGKKQGASDQDMAPEPND